MPHEIWHEMEHRFGSSLCGAASNGRGAHRAGKRRTRRYSHESSPHRDREALLARASRPAVAQCRFPVSCHFWLEFGSITAATAGDHSSGMHRHSGHVHVESEFDRADVHELTLRVLELDLEFAVPLAKHARESHPDAVDFYNG